MTTSSSRRRHPIAHQRPLASRLDGTTGRTTAPAEDRPTTALRRRSEAGYVLVWCALVLIVMFGFAGFAVDTANLWYTGQKMQKAADSAALGGVVFMPSDLDTASTTAKDLAARNGFVASGVSGFTANGATVVASQEPNPSRLRVKIVKTVPTFFAQLIGVRQITITREAVAEFQGPVPMGSPTNNLGNQPAYAGDTPWLASNPPKTPNVNPQIWSNIAGFATFKENGDRYTASQCGSGVYACTNGHSPPNEEYDGANGYFYNIEVNVTSADLTKYLSVQGYDPAFVQQGDTCNDFDSGSNESAFENGLRGLNVDRWNPDNKQFCPGDHFIRSGYESNVPDTVFTFRKPDLTPWLNTDNQIVTNSGCTAKTFTPIPGASYNASNSLLNLLKSTNTTSQGQYAKAVYHTWYTLCSAPLSAFGITQPGVYDVVLQVRTTGNGAGHNRYSLRGALTTSSSLSNPDGSKVQVYASGKLPLYANATGADSRFYLARVLPGADNRVLSVQFFDVGDAGDVGTLQILPPEEARIGGSSGSTLSTFNNCTFGRSPAGGTISYTASTCTLTQVKSSNGYNGRLVWVTIPIPNRYWCDQNDAFGCWVKIKFSYGNGVSVTDTTTWTANILGDPVRLVE